MAPLPEQCSVRPSPGQGQALRRGWPKGRNKSRLEECNGGPDKVSLMLSSDGSEQHQEGRVTTTRPFRRFSRTREDSRSRLLTVGAPAELSSFAHSYLAAEPGLNSSILSPGHCSWLHSCLLPSASCVLPLLWRLLLFALRKRIVSPLTGTGNPDWACFPNFTLDGSSNVKSNWDRLPVGLHFYCHCLGTSSH